VNIPKVHGVIRRRILVNFRVDPDVIQRILPAPFRPKLHRGSAIAGICLIRLEEIRPKRFPKLVGISSENAAHRIAVEWNDDDGTPREGVYIPRRDTTSLLNHLAGGRLFPGEHHRAHFDVRDSGDRIELAMKSADGSAEVQVAAHVASSLPATSHFADIDEASAFFEAGSLGYSATASGKRLDGLLLKTLEWQVTPLAVDRVESSFFAPRIPTARNWTDT
jgi:uncharacterized protein YqjF (DUF2071 family)